MSYLYVNDQGAHISVDGGYFMVKYQDITRKIPSETLEYISVFGNVQLTTQAIQRCLSKGIIINFFSSTGSYFGRLGSTDKVNITRQRKQFEVSGNTAFSLEMCRAIASSKINNQIVVLRRYAKNSAKDVTRFIKQMTHSRIRINNSEDATVIRGYEGYAAKNYFAAIAELINPEFEFKGRNRQPPRDAFNSMLSFGYTLLMHETIGCINSKGLNPYAGFLHEDHEKHAALASDLMEEWRAVIVDTMVLGLIQGNEVKPSGFTKDEESGGVFLKHETFKTFIAKYEKKMRTESKYLKYADYPVSFRRAIWMQADRLAKAIDEENASLYMPLLLK